MGCEFSKDDVVQSGRRQKALLSPSDHGYSAPTGIPGATTKDEQREIQDAMKQRDRLVEEREKEQALLLGICSKNLQSCIDVVTSTRYFNANEAYLRMPEYSDVVAAAEPNDSSLLNFLSDLNDTGKKHNNSNPNNLIDKDDEVISKDINSDLKFSGEISLVMSLEDDELEIGGESL